MLRTVVRALLVVGLTASTASAEVVRVEVTSRRDLAGGRPYGLAGPYEKISGTIVFAVDPAGPANRIITDIDKGPRNAAGQVEFSANFFVIKPKAIHRGNGAVLYEVSNRGGKGMLGFFNRAAGSVNPETAEELGDGFLLEEGFTLLWVGWQFDVPPREGAMRLIAPVATDGGKPIRGLVRSDFVVTGTSFDHSLADRNHVPYPVADPDDPANVFTVRDTREGPRRTIPRDQWQFARLENGRIVPDRGRIHLASGFVPGKIYEVVYVSEEPVLVGLGPAAIRDTISWLKHGSADAWSIPAGAITRAIAFGVSQSGRFLRTYLYYGFNGDERGRKVFDGMLVHVAGAGRGSFNHRFAQPSRDGHPYLNFFHPTDIFPFTDVEQTDPETRRRDGLLTHGGKPDLLPKIFYTNASYEYWGRAASLIHTTVDGRADAPLMDNVRVFLFASGQHGPAAFPPRRTLGQQPSNPLDYRWFMRALLRSMDGWIARGVEPPASQYPRIDQQTLVAPTGLRFPRLPGVGTSTAVHKAYRADYGDRFVEEGIVTKEPPVLGPAFPILVPQVDADGNDLAGLRMPDLTAPLATYTGWNLFNAESGPVDVLSSMQGSYIPLARTRAERERAGDPRLSIEERYPTREHYLGLVSRATLDLVRKGYLLDRDMPAIVRHAAEHWDYVVGGGASTASGRR
jgi:hypothetical protein